MDKESGNGDMLIFYRSDKEYRDTHPDPNFDELTYGDITNHATIIRKNVKQGSHIFFHTTIIEKNGDKQRYITAHYFVKEVIEGDEARADEEKKKYKNPHIHKPYERDIIIFGDEDNEKSFKEEKNWIKFDRELAEKIEFEGNNPKIIFDKPGKKKSDLRIISDATRTPRRLTEESVRFLYNKIQSGNR